MLDYSTRILSVWSRNDRVRQCDAARSPAYLDCPTRVSQKQLLINQVMALPNAHSKPKGRSSKPRPWATLWLQGQYPSSLNSYFPFTFPTPPFPTTSFPSPKCAAGGLLNPRSTSLSTPACTFICCNSNSRSSGSFAPPSPPPSPK